MARLIRVGRRLGLVGRRLVTDAGGAPCCCGEPPPGDCCICSNSACFDNCAGTRGCCCGRKMILSYDSVIDYDLCVGGSGGGIGRICIAFDHLVDWSGDGCAKTASTIGFMRDVGADCSGNRYDDLFDISIDPCGFAPQCPGVCSCGMVPSLALSISAELASGIFLLTCGPGSCSDDCSCSCTTSDGLEVSWGGTADCTSGTAAALNVGDGVSVSCNVSWTITVLVDCDGAAVSRDGDGKRIADDLEKSDAYARVNICASPGGGVPPPGGSVGDFL